MGKIFTLTTFCSALIAATCAYSQQPSVAFDAGAKYVALGSSFAAGNGVPAQLGSCGRSDHNYSNLVAAALNLSITDVSCSGATTDNILHTPQREEAPQIQAVTPDTKLVTVTIGGNDINYTTSTFACAGTSADEHCAANLDRAAIDQAVSQLPAKLAATFDAIRARAPQAAIVVVTYPRVFPIDAVACSELELSAEDTTYLAELGQTLEDAFVSVSADRQLLIADAYVEAAGHGPCDPVAERWVNGNSVADTGIRYHPTAVGHREMARLVLAALGHSE
ncbi:MAG: SGNH/GDSL hydrolase family protein [Gammaproteobacteria bacterium]|nr:SGNH/GDSL hydrolase family protein [Pseudomonadales bacterium]MCP5347719.1 SGNH/GDSL hydrolase family protein [Pseudomonadales bacterium]